MIPGGNILNMAFALIGQNCFQYNRFLSRTPNDIGQDVATYATPVQMSGSVQPMPRNLYQQYGLDFQRNYLTFYVTANFMDIDRDVSGDQIMFNNELYQCLSKTDWFPMDNWIGILCVKVPAQIS